MQVPNQGPCQSRKTAENCLRQAELGDFANQNLVGIPTLRLGTFATCGASKRGGSGGVREMLGKLAGAWLGAKIAGPNEGAKGAILGAGAVSLARRTVPTLAAL